MHTTLRSATRLLLGLAVVAPRRVAARTAAAPVPLPIPSPARAVRSPRSYALTQVRTLGNLGGGGSGLPVTFTDGSGDQLVFLSGTLTWPPMGASI